MASIKKAEGGKPLAYSFYVDVPGGVMITSVDLFFRSKSATNGIDVQIREMDKGQPSKTILPYGEVTLEPVDISVSADASVSTTATFVNPVYLEEDTEYAICLTAEGSTRDYEVWVSQLGEFDVQTENRVTEKPTSGILFVSSNNRTWTEYQQFDLTCRVNRAVFDPADEFTAEFVNSDNDMFTLNINSLQDSIIEPGEDVYGDQELTLESTGSTLDLTVGDTITTNASGVTFTVTDIDNLVIKVELADITNQVSAGDTFDDNSSTTWTVDSEAIAKGTVESFLRRTSKLVLMESTGLFLPNMQLKSMERTMDITIDTIDDFIANDVLPQFSEIDFSDTSLVWSIDAYDGANTNTFTITPENRKQLPSEHVIKSRSNEVFDDNGTKSFRAKVTGGTNVENLSPLIDFDKISVQTYHYRINNADLTEETSTNNGSNKARYYTQTIDLERASEDLRLFVDAAVDVGGSVGVFAKFRNATDEREMKDVDWIELGIIGYNENDYKEQEFTIPDTNINTEDVFEYTHNGVTYTGFDSFQIKFVMRATNTSKYPKLKSMRAIALIA